MKKYSIVIHKGNRKQLIKENMETYCSSFQFTDECRCNMKDLYKCLVLNGRNYQLEIVWSTSMQLNVGKCWSGVHVITQDYFLKAYVNSRLKKKRNEFRYIFYIHDNVPSNPANRTHLNNIGFKDNHLISRSVRSIMTLLKTYGELCRERLTLAEMNFPEKIKFGMLFWMLCVLFHM